MKKIFISYCHRDEEWKERLVKHLKVLELEGFYQVWDDRKIKPGSDWLPQIEKALDIRENLLDKQHPVLAHSYNNLSAIYLAMDDYVAAKNYAEKAVAILQQIFPNGHPNLDKAKENLEEIKSILIHC